MERAAGAAGAVVTRGASARRSAEEDNAHGTGVGPSVAAGRDATLGAAICTQSAGTIMPKQCIDEKIVMVNFRRKQLYS